MLLLVAAERVEDKAVDGGLGIERVVVLLLDAGYRKKPRALLLRAFTGKPNTSNGVISSMQCNHAYGVRSGGARRAGNQCNSTYVC